MVKKYAYLLISKYAPTESFPIEFLSVFYLSPVAFNQSQGPGVFPWKTSIWRHLAWNGEPVIFFSVF